MADHRNGNVNNNRQIQEVPDVGGIILSAGVNFAKRHYVLSTGWIVGLLIGALFVGIAVSPDQAQAYESDLAKIDTDRLYKAEAKMRHSYNQYNQVRGWFGACSGQCPGLKKRYDKDALLYNELQAKADAQLSDAKAKLGIFSEYGVSETRDLFWERFDRGGKFAKRQTMWDVLFSGLTSMGRDEGFGAWIARIVINFCFNLALAMFGALVSFTWSLWSVVASFQPSPAEALLYFGLAVLCACSFVATFLIGIYGAIGATVYVAGQAAANQRLANGRAGQQRRMNFQQQQQFNQRQQYQQYQQPRNNPPRQRAPPPAYEDHSYDNADHMD